MDVTEIRAFLEYLPLFRPVPFFRLRQGLGDGFAPREFPEIEMIQKQEQIGARRLRRSEDDAACFILAAAPAFENQDVEGAGLTEPACQ